MWILTRRGQRPLLLLPRRQQRCDTATWQPWSWPGGGRGGRLRCCCCAPVAVVAEWWAWPSAISDGGWAWAWRRSWPSWWPLWVRPRSGRCHCCCPVGTAFGCGQPTVHWDCSESGWGPAALESVDKSVWAADGWSAPHSDPVRCSGRSGTWAPRSPGPSGCSSCSRSGLQCDLFPLELGINRSYAIKTWQMYFLTPK